MVSILQSSKKDKKQRRLFKATEMERRYYKLLKITGYSIGIYPVKTLKKITIKNHCLISGRARGVYTKGLRLSRHQIKAYFKYITGLRSSSW